MGVVQKLLKWTLAFALAGMFFMAGANKLTPRLHPETHDYLVKHSAGWPKVQPFTHLPYSAETLRVVIGVLEVLFASLMICPFYTRLSAFMFMCIMTGAVWVHLQLHEPFVMPAVLGAAATLLFLLSGDAVATPAQTKKQKHS